jgi:hypothetical protein
MSETTCHMSISLDGFVAGPDQSLEHPLGRRGIELHHWHLDEPLHDGDARARDLLLRPRGAYVMGRNMFGPIRGPWQGDWRGWWGDEPPYHAPVFVLTHYEHEPIELAESTSPAARRPCARRLRQAWSTSSSSTSFPSCSALASGFSTASPIPASSRSRSSIRRSPRTCATASAGERG